MASLVEKIDIAVCRHSASDVSQRLALRKMQPFADVTLMSSDLGEMFQGWPSRRPSHIARAGMTRRFHCDRCGACCLQLSRFGDLYAFLDDGSGVCRHYDREKRACTIYAQRPLLCRVEDGYRTWFADIPYGRYLRGVREGCRQLRRSLRAARRVEGGASGKQI